MKRKPSYAGIAKGTKMGRTIIKEKKRVIVAAKILCDLVDTPEEKAEILKMLGYEEAKRLVPYEREWAYRNLNLERGRW